MTIQYETITGKRQKPRFLGLITRDFRTEESDNIIGNLVKSIRRIEEGKRFIKYNSVYNPRITEATIRSTDGAIQCKIEYSPWHAHECASLNLRLGFNSQSKDDEEEYLGLVRIVREMGFK